jgi:hypothetical protein
MGRNLVKIISWLSIVYPAMVYILPPKYAKKLKPVGDMLEFLAGTPGGLRKK